MILWIVHWYPRIRTDDDQLHLERNSSDLFKSTDTFIQKGLIKVAPYLVGSWKKNELSVF